MFSGTFILLSKKEVLTILYSFCPSENVFLLTRDRTPSAATLQRAYAVMHGLSLDLRKLERVDQTCGGLRVAGVVRPTELMRMDMIEEQFGGEERRVGEVRKGEGWPDWSVGSNEDGTSFVIGF